MGMCRYCKRKRGFVICNGDCLWCCLYEENNKPLTRDEMIKIKEATPVWWQYSEKTGFWCLTQSGVIMVPSGRCYDISECEGRVYRHKPKGVS